MGWSRSETFILTSRAVISYSNSENCTENERPADDFNQVHAHGQADDDCAQNTCCSASERAKPDQANCVKSDCSIQKDRRPIALATEITTSNVACKTPEANCCSSDIGTQDDDQGGCRQGPHATTRATPYSTSSTEHHHHQLRMRRKSARRACAKHEARVAEMRATAENRRHSSSNRPTLDTTSLQAYFEECFCRVVNRVLAASNNPGLSDAISALGCCASRKTHKVKTVCCSTTHRTRSADGIEHQGSKAASYNDKETAVATTKGRDDPEKGTAKPVRLTLSVTGMNCSGCVAKLDQTLAKIPGVSQASVKSSFILNRTQFSYDPQLVKGGSKELVDIIRKWNGFASTVLDETADDGDENGANLYLRLTEDAKARLETSKLADKFRIVRLPASLSRNLDGPNRDGLHIVGYDPQTIGAREIVAAAGSGAELPADDDSFLGDGEGLTSKASVAHLWKTVLKTLVCALFTIPVVALAFGTWDLSRTTINSVGMGLGTVVQLLSYDMYRDAFKSVVYHRLLDINCLVIMSTTTAYVYSVVAMSIEQYDISKGRPSTVPHGFFETSTLLITLIMFGRALTEYVRLRASRVGYSFSTLQDRTATIVDDTGAESTIDVRLLHYHDVLIARPDDKIATDGVVLEGTGEAEIDESILTGEPIPAIRRVKAPVLAGSTVVHGTCRYRVTRLIHENSISTTRKLVSSAANSKSRTQEIADQVSTVLIPSVLLSAIIVFMAWAISRRLNERPQPSVARACVDALTYAIAVLAVSCPCALGLAVPMPMVTGSSLGMKNGIVFRTADAVEDGSRVKHVIFDKTGTLTQGRMKVALAEYFLDGRDLEAQQMVALLTQGNRHPVSMAVHEHLRLSLVGSSIQFTGEVENVVGAGLAGTLNGMILKGGKPQWCGAELLNHPVFYEIQRQALTPFIVVRHKETSRTLLAGDIQLVAAFGVDDSARAEAFAIIESLQRQGIQTHLLSGDHIGVVRRVATELGLPLLQVRGSCSPESKAEYIRNIQVPGSLSLWHKFVHKGAKNKVLFIGDGSNDAVALAQADVGMSMCYATDIAAGAADVGILSDDLFGLPLFLALSRRITRMIWINIMWALLYNIFAILLAGGAFEAVNVRIEPSYAGIGELVSVLPVIVASILGVKYLGKTKFKSA